ncbi:hypothetical protein HaLaN_25953 [Haematococcus lacustris]|uniref:Uncharacterized protein n=1 Tax=Haematococcus lacustris TaxID=44745 RepID=A0A699ZY53_HAELA|nr:hypothetical protein HaLaN_25953 [Haematococcus lacustris]
MEALVRDKGAALGTEHLGTDIDTMAGLISHLWVGLGLAQWASYITPGCRVGGRQRYYMSQTSRTRCEVRCELIATKATMTAIAPGQTHDVTRPPSTMKAFWALVQAAYPKTKASGCWMHIINLTFNGKCMGRLSHCYPPCPSTTSKPRPPPTSLHLMCVLSHCYPPRPSTTSEPPALLPPPLMSSHLPSCPPPLISCPCRLVSAVPHQGAHRGSLIMYARHSTAISDLLRKQRKDSGSKQKLQPPSKTHMHILARQRRCKQAAPCEPRT